jgi:alkylation response protein AidB-like acyl-CoA dehydrogenase
MTASPYTIPEGIIEACGGRAATYDRENRFFSEDFAELKANGYLTQLVPIDLGGAGANLAQYCRTLQSLAYRAPATALGLNMHNYWVGLASDLRRMGDASLEWLLKEAAAGEVFAAGHGEAGNDLPLFLSTARAERVEGGYRFHGHKIFGSMSPAWTRLGIHAMDSADPAGPQIIHAFVQRDSPGYTIKETWDVLGMRATRSDDTILEGVFVPDKYIARKVPAGGADLFVLGIFAWAEPSFASVYLGIARRALDLAVANAKKRSALAVTRSMAYHPEVQHTIGEMQMELEAITAHVDRIADDWTSGVEHGALWPMKLVTAKHHAVEGAKRIVDGAMAVSGGSGMFKTSELERLYRDVRCGGFHPANSGLAHEIAGKTALGIDLGEQPRWG